MKSRSWSEVKLEQAVKESSSIRSVIKKLGLIPAGGNYYQVKKYISEMKLDTSHFTGQAWNRGMRGIGKSRIATAQILVKGSSFQSYKLKKRLFKEGLKTQQCEECGWSKQTSGGHLPLELHHVNGDRTDNRLKNLKILCPNCHSLTLSYRYRRGKNN